MAGWIINVGFVSPAPLPPDPVISISQNTVSNFNAPITVEQAQQMLQNSETLLNSFTTPAPQSSSSSSSSTVVVVTAGVVSGAVGMCCCCFVVLVLCQKHQKKNQYRPVNQRYRP
jgi:hypothetical protein